MLIAPAERGRVAAVRTKVCMIVDDNEDEVTPWVASGWETAAPADASQVMSETRAAMSLATAIPSPLTRMSRFRERARSPSGSVRPGRNYERARRKDRTGTWL